MLYPNYFLTGPKYTLKILPETGLRGPTINDTREILNVCSMSTCWTIRAKEKTEARKEGGKVGNCRQKEIKVIDYISVCFMSHRALHVLPLCVTWRANHPLLNFTTRKTLWKTAPSSEQLISNCWKNTSQHILTSEGRPACVTEQLSTAVIAVQTEELAVSTKHLLFMPRSAGGWLGGSD